MFVVRKTSFYTLFIKFIMVDNKKLSYEKRLTIDYTCQFAFFFKFINIVHYDHLSINCRQLSPHDFGHGLRLA